MAGMCVVVVVVEQLESGRDCWNVARAMQFKGRPARRTMACSEGDVLPQDCSRPNLFLRSCSYVV